MYKIKHNKMYATLNEHNTRFNNYCSSKARIARMNEEAIKAKVSTRFAVNKFSDLTQEEFRATFTGMAGFEGTRATLGQVVVQSCLTNGVTKKRFSVEALPAAFDWAAQGKVSPVKDQGQCGSCWTFSTTGNIESQYIIKQNKQILLSEQAVVDCSHACSNVTGYGPVCNQGCNGGWPWAAMADVKTWGGLPTETAYPYTAQTGTCHMNGMQLNVPLANVTCISGPNAAPEPTMQAWLVNHGPLSIAINADPLQDYSSGIITPGWEYGKCSGKQLDHAVLLVGYGTEKGWTANTDFWNVKNSWGADWGEKGYFRLQRGVGLCGINEAVTTVFIQ
jgi:cathepsin F